MTATSQLIDQILARKFTFLASFFVIFTICYGALFAMDWLPQDPAPAPTKLAPTAISTNLDTDTTIQISNISNASSTVANITPAVNRINIPSTHSTQSTVGSHSVVTLRPTVTSTAANDTLPILLQIPALNKSIMVLNPTSRTIAGMDAALRKGTIRHPDSAVLGQEGNIFVLGHSSYLPKVINKNYQALNGIQHLKWGDTIILKSSDKVYTYQVVKVFQAKAADLTIPIAESGQHLTLATCNVFGSKEDRYIVESDFVSVHTL